MRSLTASTGGLAGLRDPAQPLLTLRDGPARVELSGATAANWAAKTANLLVDGYGAPARVGLLLPLHWQSVCVLLGAVATGSEVVVGRAPRDVEHCDLVLCTAADAGALTAVPDVLVASTHPLGAPPQDVPAGLGDFAREVPSYGDHWGGPDPRTVEVVVEGERLGAVSALPLEPDDRVLVAVDAATRTGLALLLGALQAGAALVLVPSPAAEDLAGIVADEQVTATVGAAVDGVPRLG